MQTSGRPWSGWVDSRVWVRTAEAGSPGELLHALDEWWRPSRRSEQGRVWCLQDLDTSAVGSEDQTAVKGDAIGFGLSTWEVGVAIS